MDEYWAARKCAEAGIEATKDVGPWSIDDKRRRRRHTHLHQPKKILDISPR